MAAPQLHKLATYVVANRDQITAGKGLHAHANTEVWSQTLVHLKAGSRL